MDTTPCLEIIGLSKSFARQRALEDLTVALPRGKITALLGQNGSGKSTLIKILAGVYSPDPGGRIEIAGEKLRLPLSPQDARRHNLRFVHQDLGLVKELSVAENIGIANGFGIPLLGPIKWRAFRRRAEEVIESFGIRVDGRQTVRDLGAAEQTLLAIARGFADAARGGGDAILILDEPSAALPRAQVQILFEAVRRVRARGASVVYVTHRLEEVFELADHVVILRDGRLVMTGPVSETSEPAVIEAIVGERLHDFDRSLPAPPGESSVLEARDVSGMTVDGISFSLKKGEIMGIAGLRGSGRSELARLLVGAQDLSGGELVIGERKRLEHGPRQAVRERVGFIPEDRRRLGAVAGMSIRDNVALPRAGEYWKKGILRHRAERGDVERWTGRLGVVPRDSEINFSKLSGGNQQKAILAKWLRRNPDVLVLDEPTQGIDVGAKAEILALLKQSADTGVGVVFVSSEFSELEAVCHRVLIMKDGKVTAELRGTACTSDNITRACYESGQSGGSKPGAGDAAVPGPQHPAVR